MESNSEMIGEKYMYTNEKDKIDFVEKQVKNHGMDINIAQKVEVFFGIYPIAIETKEIINKNQDRSWKEIRVYFNHEQFKQLGKTDEEQMEVLLKKRSELSKYYTEITNESYNVVFEDYDNLKFNVDYNEFGNDKIKNYFELRYKDFDVRYIKYPGLKVLIVPTEKEKEELLKKVTLLTLAQEYYEVICEFDPKGIYSNYKEGDIAVYSEEDIIKKHGSMASFYGANLY